MSPWVRGSTNSAIQRPTQRPFWGIWGLYRSSKAYFRAFWVHPGELQAYFGAIGVHREGFLRPLEAIQGGCRPSLGLIRGPEASFGVLAGLLRDLQGAWRHIFGHFGPIQGSCKPIYGLFWPLGPAQRPFWAFWGQCGIPRGLFQSLLAHLGGMEAYFGHFWSIEWAQRPNLGAMENPFLGPFGGLGAYLWASRGAARPILGPLGPSRVVVGLLWGWVAYFLTFPAHERDLQAFLTTYRRQRPILGPLGPIWVTGALFRTFAAHPEAFLGPLKPSRGDHPPVKHVWLVAPAKRGCHFPKRGQC